MASTRDRILKAAQDIMRERGIVHATTKEIAQAVGVSEGALYKHFPSKTDLFLAALSSLPSGMIAYLHELLDSVGQGSVRSKLVQLAGGALQHYADTIPMAAGLYADRELLAMHRKALKERGAGPHLGNELVAAYLRAEQKLGRLARSADPDATAYALLGACYQRIQWNFYQGTRMTRAQQAKVAKDLIDLLWRAIKP